MAEICWALGLGACGEKKTEPAADAAKDKAIAEAAAKEKEALDTAVDAYVYAYPLVTMEYTRRVSTNVAAPEGSQAPMGQFAKLREYPNASFRTVTAPNADTLYTIVWLDVSKEPWVVSIPDLKGRYALFPILSGWTDVFQVRASAPLGLERRNMRSPGRVGRGPSRRA